MVTQYLMHGLKIAFSTRLAAVRSLLVATLCLAVSCLQIPSKADTDKDARQPASKVKFAIGNVRSNVRLLRSDEIPFSEILNDNKIRERLQYLISRENPIQSDKEKSLRTSIEDSFANSRIDLDDLLNLSQEYQDGDRLFQSYQCIAIVVSCLQSSSTKFANLDSLQKDMETLAEGAFVSNLHHADANIKKKRYSDAVVSLNYAARLSDNPSIAEKFNWTPLTKRMRQILPMLSPSQQVLMNMYIERLENVAGKQSAPALTR